MKKLSDKVRGRMRINRAMTTISIRIPEDLIADLKEMAPMLGFSGYQSLLRSYVGEGMRRDEALLDEPEYRGLRESLKRQGLGDEAVAEVVAETIQRRREAGLPALAGERVGQAGQEVAEPMGEVGALGLRGSSSGAELG